ncbi:RING1 and YY1-binding protein [Neophocaena asiaeorientalis asiaeorientalis]|uniref:RING1 and YY1-binding protein n=1 Tax=Neophocaena asiaeorientalis asiaeorientalis TaxID=1706337 RepID=A0A341BJA6_NEOAA|nr:RING1 and YY1-binding protein [Neophocaena asiaeorientalis asiaeorientalis]
MAVPVPQLPGGLAEDFAKTEPQLSFPLTLLPPSTVPSGVRGLGRGFGAVYRLETGTSREADTKLRVAEEQKGAGEPGPKEALPAPGAPQASRRCERRGCCKPQRRAQTAPNYFPGAASGPGARRQSHDPARGSPPGPPSPTQVHKSARFLRPPRPFPGRRRRLLPKRQAKPAADEGFWDCSVCTFRNSAEAFKCSICDVRKGTSTRKPRINSQLVAQQVAQQYATPPPPKKEKKEKVEKQDKEKPEKDKEISPSVTKKNTNKKTKPKSDILKDPPSEANSIQSANATTKTSETNHTSRPRLKNVDRSTAQQLAVTVGNVTVIITDFKEKTRSSSTSSSTVTSSAGSEQQNQSSSGSESTDKGSSRSSTPKGDMSAVNDESF